MSSGVVQIRRAASRAGIFSVMVALLATLIVTPASAEAPSAYMQRVMNELVAAQRANSVSAFGNVLRKHMDVPSVGIAALGAHAKALPKSERPAYFSAVINFIAKYAAKEAPKYPVTSATVTGQSAETAGGASVDTRITVAGSPYDVRWRLVRSGQGYKVRDAQVLGFWVSTTLDNLFQDYINNNGNNPRALVVALNRY